MKTLFAVILGGLALTSAAVANTISVVNFETVPVLAQGPSSFGGAEQTIVVTNIATFSGGTVLGLPSSFPGIVFATSPNVYGTADFGAASNLETLTITIDPLNTVTEVSFPIFNGETFLQTYVATAFNGVTQVAQQTFTNVPANSSSGFVLADLIAANITSVTITPFGAPASFDFLIDTVAFNESVQQAVLSPEPASLCFVGMGIAGLAWLRRRKVG